MKRTRAYLEKVVCESVWRDEDGDLMIGPREKERRDMKQRCHYCFEAEIMETEREKEKEPDQREIDVRVVGKRLIVDCECRTEETIEIRYCPMCGREL